MSDATFEDFLNRLEASGIARRTTLVGCSDAEIRAIETRYGLMIPASYRIYLATMGHSSGRLLTHDHYAATFPFVLDMTADYRDDWADEPGAGPPSLPDDALVIVGRLGEQFLMIRCSSQDDSPVWYFNEYDTDIKQAFPSVLDWLNSLADEAEHAIKNGYYDQFPNGTGP